MRSSVHVVSTLRQTVVGVNALAVLLVIRTSGSHGQWSVTSTHSKVFVCTEAISRISQRGWHDY